MAQRTSATRIRVASVNAVTSEGEKPANLPLVARIPLACQLYHAYAQSNFNLSLMAWYVLMLFTKTPYERGEELYNNMKDKRIVTTWIDGQPYYSLDWGQPTPGMLRVAYIPENQSPYADPHLVEDFPLEEDGSFNMRQVTKKWHLQNAYAINVSKGKSYEPKGDMPWKLSPLAIYCLTEAMGLDTLRVVGETHDGLQHVTTYLTT
ncbi:hypothetical protein K474DRAFT_1703652 [Panus rudis PR-1116 ss-1]|nr:hypothetical protein K474DRAFT_1703652 [Panus rudis PR-1116 ss-1]